MWLPKSTYRQLRKQDEERRKVKKKYINWLPYEEYRKIKAEKNSLKLIYISSDHLGKIEDAPAFYQKLGSHFFKRYLQNGKMSLVKHLPKNTVLSSVDENWWRGRFGTPV